MQFGYFSAIGRWVRVPLLCPTSRHPAELLQLLLWLFPQLLLLHIFVMISRWCAESYFIAAVGLKFVCTLVFAQPLACFGLLLACYWLMPLWYCYRYGGEYRRWGLALYWWSHDSRTPPAATAGGPSIANCPNIASRRTPYPWDTSNLGKQRPVDRTNRPHVDVATRWAVCAHACTDIYKCTDRLDSSVLGVIVCSLIVLLLLIELECVASVRRSWHFPSIHYSRRLSPSGVFPVI